MMCPFMNLPGLLLVLFLLLFLISGVGWWTVPIIGLIVAVGIYFPYPPKKPPL